MHAVAARETQAWGRRSDRTAARRRGRTGASARSPAQLAEVPEDTTLPDAAEPRPTRVGRGSQLLRHYRTSFSRPCARRRAWSASASVAKTHAAGGPHDRSPPLLCVTDLWCRLRASLDHRRRSFQPLTTQRGPRSATVVRRRRVDGLDEQLLPRSRVVQNRRRSKR
jgi:hypothetical protein